MLTRLYNFCALTNCADGASPGPLILGTDGNFYGTTAFGGASNSACSFQPDCGTVFKITPSGTLTTLYSFCSQVNCTDGISPTSLVLARDGNFYGTTLAGGKNNPVCNGNDCGTVFRITPSGKLTTLYSFCALPSCADGAQPVGLVQTGNGSLYGTTLNGGPSGRGTVFKITTGGTLTTLYTFCSQSNCSDGADPIGRLTLAADGNLYGTTVLGGSSTPNPVCNYVGLTTGCGTVFKITPTGKFTTLYSFCAKSHCTDGAEPAGLVQANDGNFYGMTEWGGTSNNDSCGTSGYGCGTIFKITPSGSRTTLHSFCLQTNCDDGSGATNYLVQATNGTFYGATSRGGFPEKDGILFSLSVGLGPFVQTAPTRGKVGSLVTILGTDLNGASSVTFHGAAAAFTVVSSSEITTTVPTGATTGTVTVTTPKGTLSSNVAFRVP